MVETLLPIALFPEGSLASSVIVPVWIGVMVIAFFNLRFGWVMSGLVVPGYIVPMILVDPVIAGVNFLEAWLTYLICVFISNKSASWFGWSHFFGRDRFLLIVIVSIGVRLTMDTWLFDLLANQLQLYTDTAPSIRNHLHSFGLIIISLMANQMWKTGLVRGSWHLIVTVGITYLLVRYGLMTLTNFSITNLAFLYEEVSIAILASPKSYIILLCACFVASRMNLKYGWEYAGILVPSLLAMQWYQPLKILVTFAETFIILGLATIILRSKFVSNLDITGARKLVLFFTISFFYKFALASSLGVISPFEKASDYYAFGYLLSTLIALKMHDKGLTIQMSRTVLQSSLVAVLFATAIGFGLSQIQASTIRFNTPSANILIENAKTDLQGWLITKKAEAYANRRNLTAASASNIGIDHFRSAIENLVAYKYDRNTKSISAAAASLSEIGANLQLVENHYLTIDHPNDVTFGNYVINLNEEAPTLLIQAPNGMDERRSYDAALAIFKISNASFLAISNGQNVFGGTDLTNGNSIFNHFQMLTAKNNVLQVRTTNRDIDTRAKQWAGNQTIEPKQAHVWVKKRLPNGFNLTLFNSIIADIGTYWYAPNFSNRARDMSQVAFAELLLENAAATKVITLAQLPNTARKHEESTTSIEGYLNDWLITEKLKIARKGSEAYQKPSLGESLFLLEEVVLKLQELVDEEFDKSTWSANGKSQLDQINSTLSYFNYHLIEYSDISRGSRYLIVSELPSDKPKYWGTYIFRLGESSQHVVEVPRPLFELRTYEYGLHLFESLKARALLISGAHPFSNSDQTSDVIKLRNLNSLFNLSHYGLASYFGDLPLQFIQVRSLPATADQTQAEFDVHIDYTDNYQTQTHHNALLTDLVSHYQNTGLTTKVVKTGEGDGGANLGFYSQSAQLRYQENKQFAVAWLSANVRDSFRANASLSRLQRQLLIANIEISEVDLEQHISHLAFSNEVLPIQTMNSLNAYIADNDISLLTNIALTPELTTVAYIDQASKQLFLQINSKNLALAICNLNATKNSVVNAESLNGSAGAVYIQGRYRWLLLGTN